MQNLLSHSSNDESGATAIEYGLIAALVAVALITALGALGTSLSGTFASVSTSLGGAAFLLQRQEVPMQVSFRQFRDEQSGATSIEYALIAALVSIAIIVSVIAVGDSLNGIFETVVAGFG